mgnify:CR=1 FL=1
MGFDLSVGISAVTVFLQGLLSVFSPCVLPLIPLYIGYLAGGTAAVQPDGTIRYPRRRVLVNTLFFVLGISFAFFLLGMGFTALGRFFSGNRTLFTRCSGVLILVFGLYQLGGDRVQRGRCAVHRAGVHGGDTGRIGGCDRGRLERVPCQHLHRITGIGLDREHGGIQSQHNLDRRIRKRDRQQVAVRPVVQGFHIVDFHGFTLSATNSPQHILYTGA